MIPARRKPRNLWKSVPVLLLLALPLVSSGQEKDKKQESSAPSKPAATAPAEQHHPATTERPATTQQHLPVTPSHPVTTQHPVNTAQPPALNFPQGKVGPGDRGPESFPRGSSKFPGSASKGPEPHENRSSTVPRNDERRVDYGRGEKPRNVNLPNGTNARFDSAGRISSIHAHDLTINHGPRGVRVIETERRDERGERYRVVSVGEHRGFVERPFARDGRSYMRRTYVVDGHAYARVYGRYSYHGWGYYRYVPAYRWGPRFYGWAYNPWARPVYWHWGWAPGPWWGCYGCYFAPYPYYAAPAFWLTDYILAANLQAAYEAGAASASAQGQAAENVPPEYQPSQPPESENGNAVTLTPEMKQAIADEVKAQLAAEQEAAGAPQSSSAPANDEVPGALDPNERTFIVSSALNEETADGWECTLGSGDVLTRIDDVPDANNKVKVLVSTSQKNDCRAGTQFPMSVEDLQEMHNRFREQIDEGLKKLSDSQGKNGVPMAPDAVARPVAEGQAQPDPTAAAELDTQQQDANKAESEVQQAAKPHQDY